MWRRATGMPIVVGRLSASDSVMSDIPFSAVRWLAKRVRQLGRRPDLDAAFPQRAVVLLAGILDQLAVGQREGALVRPRLRVVDRVVDGHGVGDVAGVGVPERLHQVQLVAVRVALGVEPREAVEADRCRRPACRRPTWRSTRRTRSGSGSAECSSLNGTTWNQVLCSNRNATYLSFCMIWIGYGEFTDRIRPNGMHMPV